jgi:hypothetical protein
MHTKSITTHGVCRWSMHAACGFAVQFQFGSDVSMKVSLQTLRQTSSRRHSIFKCLRQSSTNQTGGGAYAMKTAHKDVRTKTINSMQWWDLPFTIIVSSIASKLRYHAIHNNSQRLSTLEKSSRRAQQQLSTGNSNMRKMDLAKFMGPICAMAFRPLGALG